MTFLLLFWEFFKTGLFAIGGGMATLPFLYHMSDRTAWFTYGQIADMIAISESTPGAIGVNMATYVGYTIAGIPGAVIATLGLITPSIIIILIIAAFLQQFRSNRFVEAAFYGLRPASTALIAAAGLSVIILSLFNVPSWKETGVFLELFRWKALILALVLFLLTNLVKSIRKLHPIWVIAASAVIGIVFSFAGV